MPVLIEFAKPAVAVAAGIDGLVLLPDELESEVFVLLQFTVDGGELRGRVPGRWRRWRMLRQQGRSQFRFLPFSGRWPLNASGFGCF